MIEFAWARNLCDSISYLKGDKGVVYYKDTSRESLRRVNYLLQFNADIEADIYNKRSNQRDIAYNGKEW